MISAQTASWFIKTTGVFAVTYAICWAAPRVFENIPDLPATTTDRQQALVFDRYFKRPTPKVAIVGSSLAYRLKEEYFQGTDIENVALPGGSPLTGLEIIDRATKRKPQILVIETNILSRGIDDLLVERYRSSTLPPVALRPFRALAASFEPKPVPSRPLDAGDRDAILNAPSAPTLGAHQKAVTEAVVEFNKTTYDEVIQKNAAKLKSLVEKAQEEGIKIFLFELPTSPAISRTRYSEMARSEIARLFRSADLLTLSYNKDDLHWDDGSHLDERSALIVAGALERALIPKLLTQSQAAK